MLEKIVVVDAEPVVRSVVTRTLERAGYDVYATGDVREALSQCDQCRPALILTNVYLNGVTGHEAMQLFRDRCPGTPVLMVSGLPDSSIIDEWIDESGFDAFPKPFAPKDLVAKVREMLRQPA